MTMTTYLRTDAPVNPIALIDFLTVLCEGDPETCSRAVEATHARNGVGQGFAAWLAVDWNEGPLDIEGHDRPWGYDEEEFVPAPKALVQAEFDTTYGYRDDFGRGCGQFHADLIEFATAWIRGQYPSANVWWTNGETCYNEWPTGDDTARLRR